MKHTCFLRLVCLLLALVTLGSSALAEAVSPGEVERLAGEIIAASGVDSADAWLAGPLTAQAGIGAEWYVLSLSQSGRFDFTAYTQQLLTYLSQNTVTSASSRLKYALVLTAVGCPDEYVTRTMDEAIGQQGLMSWVFGLHLMNNGHTSAVATAEEAVAKLLSMRLPDGGWALTGKNSDVDVTAMVIQALAPWYASNTEVAAAVDEAVAMLSARQKEDGTFASYGVCNPESVSQVWIALSSLGIDALTDERFIKNGATLLDAVSLFRLPDGSYSHTLGGASNGNATAQVFCALTAYQRLHAGKPGLYLLDVPFRQEVVTPAQPIGYKPIAAACIGAAALLACVVLFLAGKRHRKNFLAVFIVAAAMIAFVFATDFQSAGSYYTGQPVVKTNPIGTVTMTIRCDVVAGQTDERYIPADGVILPAAEFPFEAGDTAYTLLTDAARAHGIHVEHSGPEGMVYITGINYLYEFSFGDLSGWTYRVNGERLSVGCDQYIPQDGDTIEWLYTLELGNDLD